MSTDAATRGSYRAWTTIAMFAPLAHYSGGSWAVLLVLAMISVGLMGLLPKKQGSICSGKMYYALGFVWTMAMAAQYLPLSALYWPGEESDVVVPAVILLLAAYSCSARPERIAAVLYRLLILMLIPFGLAVWKDANPGWILPREMNCSMWVIPILLLPAAGGFLCECREREKIDVIPYILGIGLWIGVSSVLSPGIAKEMNTPFRELSRTLDFGAGSRFESLVSVMVTFGWFGLASLYIKLGMRSLEQLGIKRKCSPWLSVVPMIILIWNGVTIDPILLTVMAMVLWILIPVLSFKKSSKKDEKSA